MLRLDLNGYSAWAREKPIEARVALLDKYFSTVVPLLDQVKGVYFRDEGDCIVCLFSSYFGTNADDLNFRINYFARTVASQRFGELTAKVAVAAGPLAFFQKAHEVGTDDWSAEGEAFVRAARLEAAMSSDAQVVYFADDFDNMFAETIHYVSSGERYYWTVDREKLQVPGLALVGGWADVVYQRYVEGGRIAA